MGNSVTENILIAVLFVVMVAVTEMASGLRIVQVIVPSAVESGNNATLICEHDTEGDTLYSVKWYKGRREFFRYTPKEIPAVKLFSMAGISVDQTQTNATQLVLKNVTPKVSGKYSCEVSADAPSFHTYIVSGEMEVVVIPAGEPIITGIKPYYTLGEILQANCTLNGSIPSALLEWKINNFPAYPSDIIKYDVIKDAVTKLQTRTIGLHFLLSHLYFVKGKLMIQCTAKIHDLYNGETIKYIEEDRPQVYSPSLSYLSDEVNQRSAGAAATAMATKATACSTTTMVATIAATVIATTSIITMQCNFVAKHLNLVICTTAALMLSIQFLDYVL